MTDPDARLERWLESVLATPGLTAVRDAAQARRVLVDDARAAAELVEGGPVVDVGSGGGSPGIPVALARLAATEDYDALIAVGCVIRGETFHFEIVARESAQGVARVSADYGLPVANAILTTDTDEQARSRVEEKGRDAARVAVEMANLMLALDEDGGSDATDTEE